MPQRTAVVSGASIAGLSTAFWLARTGWRVTVLERAPAFREGGQNVDVRGVAREVLARMGLVEAVRAMGTTETGTVLVDERGRVTHELPGGPDGATAELEVLRGDLARVLRDALPAGVQLRFGLTVGAVDDAVRDAVRDAGDDAGDGRGAGQGGVAVTTTDGDVLHADLLVVAEGVRSSTRDLLLPGRADLRDLGVTMAFGTIARTASDDTRWRWLTTTGGRQVHLRPDPHGTTRAVLTVAGAGSFAGLGRDDAVARLRELFAGAGWEAPRVLDGLATSDDVYLDDLTQVRLDAWSTGRAVLVGDAAWCVTPMGGGGASLALTSGLVLAAELAAAPATAAGVRAALEAYERWMRPLVDDVQHLPRGLVRFACPRTRLGLAARRAADAVLLSRPLRPVAARLTRVAETDQQLPDLPAAAA